MRFLRYRYSTFAIVACCFSIPAGLLFAQSKTPTPYHKDGEFNIPRVQPVAAHQANTPESSSPLREIRILPASISLTIPRLNQRVVVEGTFTDGHEEDVTAKANITSSDPHIALVDKEDYVHPQSDGQATLVAMYEGQRSIAPVTVRNFSTPFEWSFRNHVLPVMTKVGCNSGPCHGAAAGKNGFKLTLRGYDPETDYFTLTHQALARRTDELEPARSLILLKPTLAVAHGGGERFPVGSPEYQVIAGWIAAGMPPPQASDPRITGLEVLPKQASLRPGAAQQLIVMAKFSDGHAEDVTRWAKFTSGDEGVATVDDSGHVVMHRAGEAPVTVWYLSKVTFARLRIPYAFNIEEAVYDKAPRHNFIDDAVLAHLKTLQCRQNGRSGDPATTFV